jgi:hypothetical protein
MLFHYNSSFKCNMIFLKILYAIYETIFERALKLISNAQMLHITW